MAASLEAVEQLADGQFSIAPEFQALQVFVNAMQPLDAVGGDDEGDGGHQPGVGGDDDAKPLEPAPQGEQEEDEGQEDEAEGFALGDGVDPLVDGLPRCP